MTLTLRITKIACLLSAAVTFSCPSVAGEPRLVETYGNWDAYIVLEGSKKVCYMASIPTKSEGNYSKRGEVFALITHRPDDGSKNVFSFITGYSFKPGTDASVEVDGQKFVLFTKDDTAWAPDAETDNQIAKALKAGKAMVVRGTSSKGTKTSDTFSLKGSTSAYEKISKECS